MKIMRNIRCEVVVHLMWLSFWLSQRTLGLTALSLALLRWCPHFM